MGWAPLAGILTKGANSHKVGTLGVGTLGWNLSQGCPQSWGGRPWLESQLRMFWAPLVKGAHGHEMGSLG